MSKRMNFIKGCMILFLPVVMIGCGNKTKCEQKDLISFESYSFKTQAQDKDLDSMRMESPDYSGLWEISSEGVLPVAGTDDKLKALRDTIMSLASIKEEDGKITRRLASYLQVPGEATDSVKPRSLELNKVMVNLLNPELLVMQVFQYSYPEGAAHGNYSTVYVNYDIHSGKILTLPDIFVDNFQEMLLPRIVTRLQENVDLIVESEGITIPQNFRVTENGIEFIYALYSVAPYSEGEPRVMFYVSDLEDILSQTGKALLGE